MNRQNACCWSALAVAAGLIVVPAAALAQPTVTQVVPGAVQPGKTTELKIVGTKLASPARVWTSFPAAVSVLADQTKAAGEKAVHCQVTVPAGVQPGIVGLAVATPAGASDVVYVMVDPLPSVVDAAENDRPGAAQEIALPVAVDGASSGTLADYFRFRATAGERISCEVVGNRLGWDLDPLVRVLSAEGKELLLADDDAASGVDPRFVFTAPANGSYLIELRDNRFKPGGRYRLRLGHFPLVTTPLPLAVQRGAATDVAFLGPRIEHLVPVRVFNMEGSPTESPRPIVASLGGEIGWWANVALSDLPVFLKQGGAAVCDLPCVVSGVLDKPRQQDRWKLRMTKGTPVRLQGMTRSLGSAAVLTLKVSDEAGKQLAVSPVTDTDEPLLSFTPPSDGIYVLTVAELAGRGGVDFGYAVECRSGPQFALVLKNDKNNRVRHTVAKGGAFYLDVQSQRAGYDGPIVLAINSPRSGWQVFNNVIAAKANETRLYVVPPADFEAGELLDVRVVGRGQAGEQPVVASLTTTVQLRTARPYFPYPPAWQDGAVFVSQTAAKPAFFTIASPSSVELDAHSRQGNLAIEMERIDAKFKDTALVVLPLGLPAGVTAEVKRSGNGPKETYNLALKGPKELKAGQYPFRYFAYGELAGQGQAFYSGDVRLVVSDESADAEKEKVTP